MDKKKYMENDYMQSKKIKICDECESQYFVETSKMANLCPNCSHYLYGYENCNHKFENGRCLNCNLDEKIYKKIIIEDIKNLDES